MNKLWQILLGMERSPGSEVVGDSRLELAALPEGPQALALVLGAIALKVVLLCFGGSTAGKSARSRGRNGLCWSACGS